MKFTRYIVAIVLFGIVLILALMFGLPKYNVWQQEMAGKAEMAKAEQNRKILVEEAKARLEAEKLNAQAEIERARGMAEAMKVENNTLNETYNQYLFIRTLEKLADKGSLPQIIYVPSNGLLPVMNLDKGTASKTLKALPNE
ncbi:MAG: hypothetical protein KF880_01865 [Ferruginibacter sp.]|nr:hypothetical protein [Ferruginibacter sp.]